VDEIVHSFSKVVGTCDFEGAENRIAVQKAAHYGILGVARGKFGQGRRFDTDRGYGVSGQRGRGAGQEKVVRTDGLMAPAAFIRSNWWPGGTVVSILWMLLLALERRFS